MAQSLTTAVKDVTKNPHGMYSKFWSKNDKMIPEVRQTLLELGQKLWDEIKKDGAILHDIVFTGSLTGPRWSNDSDIDLHLIVEFENQEINEDILEEYYKIRSRMWNSQHDINIEGFPVEIYVQNVNQQHHSVGVYSLITDEWIVKKSQEDYAPFQDVAKKARILAKDIKNSIKKLNSKPTQVHLNSASNMMEKLRDMRSQGLKETGEGSVKNLAYKALRRAGLLDKLNDAIINGFDKIYGQ